MANLQTLSVYLRSNVRGFTRGFSRAQGSLRRFKQAASLAAVASAGLAVKIGFDAVEAASKQEKAERKLQAVLRATGHAAGFTSDQLAKYADTMSLAIGTGDEDIISAMGVLTSFKNIAGDAFKETMDRAADVSAVLGTDLQSSVIQLGKAINDPAKGLSMLSRSGITFSDAQSKMIKGLQKSGDLMGAQALILKELKTQFGGAAEEMSKAEPWKHATNALGDLKEQIGFIIMDVLQLDDTAGGFTETVRGWIDVLKANGPGIAAAIKQFYIEIKYAFKRSWLIVEWFFGNMVGTFDALAANAKTLFTWFKDSWRAIWDNIGMVATTVFLNMVENLSGQWKAFTNILKNPLSGDAWVDFAKATSFAKMGKDLMEGIAAGADLVLPKMEKAQVESLKSLLDKSDALDKEKEGALAKVFSNAANKTNKDTENKLKELRALGAAKPSVEKSRASEATRKFAGALLKGSIAARSAILRRSQKDIQKDIKENTAEQVDVSKDILKAVKMITPYGTLTAYRI
jgi:hypothetical protein